MSDSEYQNHELLSQVSPPASPPTIETDQANVTERPRDDGGRFAREQDEAPEAPEDLEASDEQPDETADTGESDTDESDERETTKPKKKTPWSQRVSQLTAEKHQWRTRAEQAERQQQELVKTLQQQIDPNLEFENPAQFTAEIVKRSLAEERYRDTQAQIQQAREAEVKAAAQTFFERVEAVRDQMPDFDAVFNDSVPIPREMVPLFGESDLGPQIAYHLAKNPSIARNLATMTEVQQAREFGRLEAQLSAPPPKRTTKAPAPARRLQSNGSAGTFNVSTASVSDIASQIYGKR